MKYFGSLRTARQITLPRALFPLRSLAVTSLLMALICPSISQQVCCGAHANQRITAPEHAEPPDSSTNSAGQLDSPIDGPAELNKLITQLALAQIPHQYEEDKDWGKQERRWNGIEIKRDGARLKTHRKWKLVNHGTWKKYSAKLIAPEQNFSIQLKNLREIGPGEAGFDLQFDAKLDLFGRQSKWIKGVQLYSVSAEGHATVRLIVSFRMTMELDFDKMPPDILFSPTATNAELLVDEFRIDRLSDIGGEIAQQVSRLARAELDKKIASKKVKLLDKINKAIAKNSKKFKVSTSQLNEKWKKTVGPFVGSEPKQLTLQQRPPDDSKQQQRPQTRTQQKHK